MADIQFRYVADQSHQTEAVEAVCGLFDGQEFLRREFTVATAAGSQPNLAFTEDSTGHANAIRVSQARLLENLHRVQEDNCLMPTEVLTDGRLRDFTVEMETGTGKTYVYIRTIHELNRRYGLTKFVIVVPSVAVREGVTEAFKSTKAHFEELYGRQPMDVFTYDSADMGPVANFALSTSIEVMIINIQAFNKAFDKTTGEAAAGNLFHRPSERLAGGRSPRELVAECNPIVIIDEPQSVDNTAQAKAAIASLNPLFCLRYSATHREPYNMVYRLTPVDAFEQHLVKGICVDSVASATDLNGAYVGLDSISTTKSGVRARLTIDVWDKGVKKRKKVTCKQGDDLYLKSHENSDYETVQGGWVIHNLSYEEGNQFVEFQNGCRLEVGEAQGDVAEETIKRAQIRRTIVDHLTRQLQLYPKGIKVLSLLFLDKVERYRVYGEDGQAQDGEYARMFDEEWAAEVEQGGWRERYEKDGVPWVYGGRMRDGYFSKDSKGRLKNTNGSTVADSSTFEAIMRSKARLVSFPDGHDSVRDICFIFSHSALKEGWDNPNIFQICTLQDTRNAMTKRQKIGRGLRLCVDQEGQRNPDPALNVLTVVANESYEGFAADLQREFEEDGYRFGILTDASFSNLTFINEEGREERLGFERSAELVAHFKECGLATPEGRVTPKLKEAADRGMVEVPQGFEPVRTAVEEVIRAKSAKVPVRNTKDERPVKLDHDVALDPDFQALWDRIRRRTRYELDVDTDLLVEKATRLVRDEMETVRPVAVTSSRATLSVDGSGIATEAISNAVVNTSAVRAYDYPDPISELQDAVGLTRKTIKRILVGAGRMNEFRVDPATFLARVARCIDKAKAEVLADCVRYVRLPEDQWYTMEDLDPGELKAYLGQNAFEPAHDKSLYTYVVYDSTTIERPYGMGLELSEKVKVYAKLPSRFRIDTPLGSYNPDWAYVEEQADGSSRVYFVVETKGKARGENRPAEEAKIDCAERHFRAIDADIRYEVQTEYKLA